MFFAYVIQSQSDKTFFYKGPCEHLEKRLEQHNSRRTVSIKNKVPFKLVYYEEFESRLEAIKREKYFKSATGRDFLKAKLTTFL